MNILLAIVTLIAAVLNTILFFKIWGMCDNVAKLKERFCDKKDNNIPEGLPLPDQIDTSSTLLAGQSVQRLSDGVVMLIDRTDGGNFACVSPNTRVWMGIYSRSQITPCAKEI